jgi:hypothetical protein
MNNLKEEKQSAYYGFDENLRILRPRALVNLIGGIARVVCEEAWDLVKGKK